jgi:cell shape-determining protein MreD
MDTLVAIPILLFTILLQVTAVSRLPLVHGTADLVLLTLIAWGIHSKTNNAWIWALIGGLLASIFTAVPWLAVVIPYIVIALSAQLLHGRFWQSPILAMLLITLLGTFVVQLTTMTILNFNDIQVNFTLALESIIFPSLILNLMLALPIYLIVKDISRWVYPVMNNE